MKIRFAIPLLAAALTFSVSACGSDSGDSASDGGSGASATASESAAMSKEEAEKELKERGYEVKKNADGTTTVTQGDGGGTQVTAKQLEKFKKNAECLRGKGYDMPTPTAEKPLVTPKGQFDQDKFNKDSMACAQQGG